MLGRFDEYQFYMGESMDPDGMHILVEWEGETPYFYFFKDGLIDEKCVSTLVSMICTIINRHICLSNFSQ